MGKKKAKLVLMPPINIDWPKVDKDTEDKIITALIQKLHDFPKLEGKRGEPGVTLPEYSVDEEQQRRARLRGQVVVGHRQVSKALDWGQLALVLVAGDIQPAILRKSLLPLASSRGCPALCLSSLQPTLSPELGLTSVLAMGFKKTLNGEGDFDEFINMAAALAPPLPMPGMKSAQKHSKVANQAHTDREKDGEKEKEKDGEDKEKVTSNSTDRDKDSGEAEEEVEKGDKGKDGSNNNTGTDGDRDDAAEVDKDGQSSVRETDSSVEGGRDRDRPTTGTSANAESTAVPGKCESGRNEKEGVVVGNVSSSSLLLSSSSSSAKGQEKKVAPDSGDCTQLSSSSSTSTSAAGAGAGGASSVSSARQQWRLMDKEQEQTMMDSLLQVLEPYTEVFQTPRSKMIDEEKQTRKLINSCLAVDPGALRHSALSGDLDLLLVNSDLNPDPHPHPSLIPIIPVAAEAGCCVLHLTSLRQRLGAFVRDPNLRALGFKKRKAGSSGQQLEDLRRFVSQYNPRVDTATKATTSKTSNSNKTPVTKNEPKRVPKPAPVLDVSSLYVYKKKDTATASASAATEAETNPAPSKKRAAGAATVSDSFISLSSSFYSEPTVMYLGGRDLGEGEGEGQGVGEGEGDAICELAVMDTTGSGKIKITRDTGVPTKKKGGASGSSGGGGGSSDTEATVGGGFSGIMGMDEGGSDPQSNPSPVSVAHEPRGRKVKAGLKRVLEQSAERGEFVSFSLTPTTICASLPNPNKKRRRHKKFKK